MGQKVNPVGMRIGLNKNWNSRWFAEDKDYSRFSENFLNKKLVKIPNSLMLKSKERKTIKVIL